MALIESLTAFQFIAFVPHLLLYEFYLIFKYVIVFSEIIQHKISTSVSTASIITVVWGFLVTCCCCFGCCFNCCLKKEGCFCSVMEKLYHLSQKLNRFLVKVLFGPKEGIVERFAVYKKDEEDDDGIPILYVRNMKLNRREISLLAILIMTFGLLAAITAWDSYFLDETYLCSEEPGISCFPIEIDYNAYDDLNLSSAQEHRINDCSYWMSENVSSRVTFLCFQWVFNSKGVVSDVGGLLTMFLITMKITSSGSLVCLNWAIKKHSKKINQENVKENRLKDGVRIFKNCRIFIGIGLGSLEIFLGALLISITAYARIRNNNAPINFFYQHGNQLLLIFGIFSTLVLLPLEDYAMAEEMPTSNYDEEIALPDDKNDYQPLTQIKPKSSHNPQCEAIAAVSLTPGDLQGQLKINNNDV